MGFDARPEEGHGRQTLLEFAAEGGSDLSGLTVAEGHLLRLADFIYGHSSLKPMSKALFFLSRCLVATSSGARPTTGDELVRLYEDRSKEMGLRLEDDFAFAAVTHECEGHLSVILDALREIQRVSSGADVLGLAFNTLLRGKWEGGEGLGTYLTPEEVVDAMVGMALGSVASPHLSNLGVGPAPLLFGDICGGTGRFVHRLARGLIGCGLSREQVETAACLFDQSSLAVDFARLNFVLEHLNPRFQRVPDSLTADAVSKLRGRFLILATNPPFGTGKYFWSEALGRALPPTLLSVTGIKGPGDSADPASLFFIRNLDLLAEGGVLAIVLPDGVLHSSTIRDALAAFERVRETTLEVSAVVSLPVAAFSLGGTVAKTSFILVQKQPGAKSIAMYVAGARHIGFVKRGNRRVPDPQGNDLASIPAEFLQGGGQRLKSWREYDRLGPGALLGLGDAEQELVGERVRDVAHAVRRRADGQRSKARFHVSVLDVDETGLIDLLGASKNQPVTDGLECLSGDVLVSCINPRIWRVAVVPNLDGNWSCSPEFLVLRPRRASDSWRIALGLHHRAVSSVVQSLAGGTSSSRQRVPKDTVLDLRLPDVAFGHELEEHASQRENLYRSRLKELDLYHRLHDGQRATTS